MISSILFEYIGEGILTLVVGSRNIFEPTGLFNIFNTNLFDNYKISINLYPKTFLELFFFTVIGKQLWGIGYFGIISFLKLCLVKIKN